MLIHPLGNRRVNLLGEDIEEVIPGNRMNPEVTIIIRGATQRDLAEIYAKQQQGGTPIIEYIPDDEEE